MSNTIENPLTNNNKTTRSKTATDFFKRKVKVITQNQLAGENLFFEISAKDGNNISLAFEQLSFKILREQKKRKLENDQVLRGVDGRKSINLADINVNKNKKGKCC